MYSTRPQGDDSERVGVTSPRNFGANESEALRVDQFRSGAVEEPSNV